jgi:isocitrate dehydrogenase
MPIIYTWTDEAPPSRRTRCLPVVRAFAGAAGVPVETRDISLAGRVLAAFPTVLGDEQRVSDDLAELGRRWWRRPRRTSSSCRTSARRAAAEGVHRGAAGEGIPLPDYPDEPKTDEERDIRPATTGEGERREPGAAAGQLGPARAAVGEGVRPREPAAHDAVAGGSDTHVATMGDGDFRSNEKSVTCDEATTVRIEHVADDGTRHGAQGRRCR